MSDEPINDEPIEPRPLHFTAHSALSIEEWPPVIAVTEAMLQQAHLYGATVDGNTLRFAIGNGEATYRVDRSTTHGRGFVAELVEGNDKRSLAARRKKYEAGAEE